MSRLPRCSVKEAVEKQICSPEEPPWYNECFISLLPLIWQNERKRWQADIQISKTFWALWSSSGSSDEEWMKIVETRNKSTKQTTQYSLHSNIGLIFSPHCDIFPCTWTIISFVQHPWILAWIFNFTFSLADWRIDVKSLCESNKNHSISPVCGYRIWGDRAWVGKKINKNESGFIYSALCWWKDGQSFIIDVDWVWVYNDVWVNCSFNSASPI